MSFVRRPQEGVGAAHQVQATHFSESFTSEAMTQTHGVPQAHGASEGHATPHPDGVPHAPVALEKQAPRSTRYPNPPLWWDSRVRPWEDLDDAEKRTARFISRGATAVTVLAAVAVGLLTGSFVKQKLDEACANGACDKKENNKGDKTNEDEKNHREQNKTR